MAISAVAPVKANDALKLANQFLPQHRYANFGAVMRSFRLCGFRGISDLTVQCAYPITAISGLNGAGKSTIGQLAVCAYKKPSTAINHNRYYVAEFFPSSVADPTPFDPAAKVIYSYETNQLKTPQEVTVSRVQSEWSGYKRQPERYCYYVGFTVYIPKVERRDLSIYKSKGLELRQVRSITNEVRDKVSTILGQQYDDIHFQSVGHGKRESELGIATKYNTQYSENHMGFGEGRILYIITLMEEAPEQSLFVLEEPETSLHEEAQHRFARYLVDVCVRRHHQIILSTHSSVILEALPPQSRKLLVRDSDGVDVYDGISATRARAILSGGAERGLSVCVEDDFGKLLLSEILRVQDPMLLKAVNIVPIGSKEAVLNGVRLLRRMNHKAIGVRDGDSSENIAEKVFKLPGSSAPEREVFLNSAAQSSLFNRYGLNVGELLQVNGTDEHHNWPELIADAVEENVAVTNKFAVEGYVKSLPDSDRQHIVAQVRSEA